MIWLFQEGIGWNVQIHLVTFCYVLYEDVIIYTLAFSDHRVLLLANTIALLFVVLASNYLFVYVLQYMHYSIISDFPFYTFSQEHIVQTKGMSLSHYV